MVNSHSERRSLKKSRHLTFGVGKEVCDNDSYFINKKKKKNNFFSVPKVIYNG